MRNISFGTFLWNAFWYLVITGLVAEVLFRDYVLDFHFGMFGATLPAVVYLVPIAFVAYLVQRALARGHGWGRFADLAISAIMLAIIGIAILVWVGVPIVVGALANFAADVGVKLSTEPNDYKLATVVIFGAITLFDVVGRDIFGIGRQRMPYAFSGGGTVVGLPASTDVPEGHEPVDLPSETGRPHYRTPGFLDIHVVPRLILPNGRMIYPTHDADWARAVRRLERHETMEATPAARPADAADAGSDAGATGGGDGRPS